jgi:hypothetical protein
MSDRSQRFDVDRSRYHKNKIKNSQHDTRFLLKCWIVKLKFNLQSNDVGNVRVVGKIL